MEQLKIYYGSIFFTRELELFVGEKNQTLGQITLTQMDTI